MYKMIKESAYYHGHSLPKVKKMLKEGIPIGTYLGKIRWVSDLYALQYKGGKTLKIHIPKEKRHLYLTKDPENITALSIFNKLNAAMRGNQKVIRDIPKEFIQSKTMTPKFSGKALVRYFKELSKDLEMPYETIVESFKSSIGKL